MEDWHINFCAFESGQWTNSINFDFSEIQIIVLCFFIPSLVGFKMIGGVFPVIALAVIFGFSLAVLVAFTSSNDKPPRYHCVREREGGRGDRGNVRLTCMFMLIICVFVSLSPSLSLSSFPSSLSLSLLSLPLSHSL